MPPEIWLLSTALVFTLVGYYMGKSAGQTRGIEMCLEAMIHMKLVKLKKMPNGEEEVVKYDDA
tara:strand:+ start:331 stop:519 length:189 start_codon:yes stop_codon:yes gene_type:complete